MARGWSRNLSRAGRPFQDPRKEGAFQRFFAHSYLPWDVTINCVLLACIALHAQLMLEATALGCNRTVSGPGWFQGTTLSRWISSSSDQAETATAAAVQHARSSAGHRCTSPPDNAHIDTIMRGQCAAAVLAYPCSEAWPYRVHFAWRNWQQLSAAALSNPATQRLWWSHVLPLVATSAAVVLLCLVGSAFVLVNRHRQSNSSSPGAAEASSSRSSNAATPAASSEMLKHAASVPAWWPRLRNISTALLSLLSGMAVSVALLLDPLPPHLLPWSLAYVTSSAGGGMFAEATAVATLVFMVGGQPVSQGQHSACTSACGSPRCTAPGAQAEQVRSCWCTCLTPVRSKLLDTKTCSSPPMALLLPVPPAACSLLHIISTS